MLAPDIDRGARSTFVPVGRGYVDDAAATLCLHHAQLVLHAEQRAKHIGVEGGCVAFGSLLSHRSRLTFGACGIDGGVDPAEACDGLVDQTAHVVLAAHVGANESRLGTEAAEFGFQCLAFSFPAAGRDDPCAVLGKGHDTGAADASQCAGDQYDVAVHSSSSLFVRRRPTDARACKLLALLIPAIKECGS